MAENVNCLTSFGIRLSYRISTKSAKYIVECRLKARISESEWASIVRQRLCIHGSVLLSGWQNGFTRQSIHNRRYHGNENQNSCSSRGNEYTNYRCIEYVRRNPWRCRLGRPTVDCNRPNRTERRSPRDSDPRMTALARPSSNCKRQTRPVVRKSAPHQQTRNCPTVIKIWS
jgi:hypothetical protein